MSIIGLPFNQERVINAGAKSPEEFREWISRYGDSFLHNIPNPTTGDLIVFGWIKRPGEWMFVGDAIVKQNHMSGSVDWCDCTDEEAKYYKWHIITGGYRSYPTSVSSKAMPSIKLQAFTMISMEEYLKIIQLSVSHWNRDSKKKEKK